MTENARQSGSGPGRTDEPGFIEFTGELTDTENPVEASRIADMFLILLAGAATVMGALLGAMAFLAISSAATPTFAWKCAVVASVGIGAFCGAGAVMLVLHFKQMVEWEHRRTI
jgi:hypothetical protein